MFLVPKRALLSTFWPLLSSALFRHAHRYYFKLFLHSGKKTSSFIPIRTEVVCLFSPVDASVVPLSLGCRQVVSVCSSAAHRPHPFSLSVCFVSALPDRSVQCLFLFHEVLITPEETVIGENLPFFWLGHILPTMNLEARQCCRWAENLTVCCRGGSCSTSGSFSKHICGVEVFLENPTDKTLQPERRGTPF